jgi:hypothetical protein
MTKRFEISLDRRLLQAAADCLLAWPKDDPDSRIDRERWAHKMSKCARSKTGKVETVIFTTSWEEAENIYRFSFRFLERTVGVKLSETERAFLDFGAAMLQKAGSPRGRRRSYEIDPLEAVAAWLSAGTQEGAVEVLRKKIGINDSEEKLVNLRGVQKAIKKGMPGAKFIASVEGISMRKRRKPSE